jgi:uncharacterized Zn finger protein
MCKHVAAVLYGIGARLDEQPELLFKLRKVNEKDLIAKAGTGVPLSKKGPADDKVLADDDLSELFGLELGTGEDSFSLETATPAVKPASTRRPRKAAPAPEDAAAPAKSAGRRSSGKTTKNNPKSKARTRPKTEAKKRRAAK